MKLDFTAVGRKPKQQFPEVIQIILCLSNMQQGSFAHEKSKKHPALSLPLLPLSPVLSAGLLVNTFRWSCKNPGKEEMICQSYGLHNVFKEPHEVPLARVISLSSFPPHFLFEVADCFQRQAYFQPHFPLFPSPVPYFLRNTVAFLQTSWGRQKPTQNMFLWCYSSCLHPPMESLLKRSSFLPFLCLGKISTSVLPSNKKTWKEMEPVSSSFPKMCFKLQTFSLSQCPWHLFMEGWYLPLPLGSFVVPLTMNWATLQHFIGLLQEEDNPT